MNCVWTVSEVKLILFERSLEYNPSCSISILLFSSNTHTWSLLMSVKFYPSSFRQTNEYCPSFVFLYCVLQVLFCFGIPNSPQGRLTGRPRWMNAILKNHHHDGLIKSTCKWLQCRLWVLRLVLTLFPLIVFGILSVDFPRYRWLHTFSMSEWSGVCGSCEQLFLHLSARIHRASLR